MIRLTFNVDNISVVHQVYDQIELQRSLQGAQNFEYVTDLGPIILYSNVSTYVIDDAAGQPSHWYRSRYYSSITNLYSAWSEPVLGEAGVIFYNPLYPDEIHYGSAQKLIIKRIRRLIGDPVRLRRDFGEDAMSSVHLDSKTYELSEMGWPASVIMGNKSYSDINNPSVNSYKYLRFNNYIGDLCEQCVTYSGCDGDIEKEVLYGIDIWYYTFRHSDREIMEAYDTCPPPPPLSELNANPETYMIQTAIELLRQELWEDSTEDGAVIRDEGTSYDPGSGLRVRKQMLDDLEKKLDKLVKSLMLTRIAGVLID